MFPELPTPPAEFQTDVVDTFKRCFSEHVQHVVRYMKELVEHKTREPRLEE